MKEISGKIEYKNQEYKLCFNLNVIEQIQEEYGSLDEWGDLTSGREKKEPDDKALKSDRKKKEPDIKALKFGFAAMINEGIDIDNETNGTDNKPLTLKQVGRMITDIGLENITDILQDTVIKSTQSEEKNA